MNSLITFTTNYQKTSTDFDTTGTCLSFNATAYPAYVFPPSLTVGTCLIEFYINACHEGISY